MGHAIVGHDIACGRDPHDNVVVLDFDYIASRQHFIPRRIRLLSSASESGDSINPRGARNKASPPIRIKIGIWGIEAVKALIATRHVDNPPMRPNRQTQSMYGRFQGPTPGKAGAIARGTGLRSAPFVRRGMAYRLVQISSMSDDPATALAVRS